jgi:hypothetical protein
MGLLDIFRKKKTDDTFPENELEKCLSKAAADSSARKEFYTRLLWSELVVLTAGDSASNKGQIVLKENSQVQLVKLQNGYLPVFTSTNRVFDGRVIKEPVPFMSMKGRDLFNLVKGSPVIINPYSNYGKEILPQEIEGLLSGEIFDRLKPMVVEKDTPIQIGQPQNYPTELIKALSQFFKKKPEVKYAYIAMTRTNPNDNQPRFLIAIDIEDGELFEVSKFAGPIAEKYLTSQEAVDFIQISDSDISNYFKNETRPFYFKE